MMYLKINMVRSSKSICYKTIDVLSIAHKVGT